MGLKFNGGKKIGRNDLCPCESGLKYKICHGDEQKKAVVQRAADELMVRLIANELYKRDMICIHGVRTGEECFECENPSDMESTEHLDGGPKIIQP